MSSSLSNLKTIQKTEEQLSFGKLLNMNEVNSATTFVRLADVVAEKYTCGPTKLQFNTANMDWTWHSKYNVKSEGVDFSLQFMSETTATVWKITLQLSVFFKRMNNTVQKKILVGVDVVVRNQVFDHDHKEWKMELSREEWRKLAASFMELSKEERRKLAFPHGNGEIEHETKDSMTVEVQMCVTNMVGFRNRVQVVNDFSIARPDSDLIFSFKKEQVVKAVFLNVGYLSLFSPYFAATQERLENISIDPETNIRVEEMVDVDHDQFVELMQIVYPSRKKITGTNVEYVLRLADRFLFNNVLADAERFLMETSVSDPDIFTKLQWSYTYSMADLQDKCISQLTTFESIKAVIESPVYSSLPLEILKSLFEKMSVNRRPGHRCSHCNYNCSN